MIRCASTTSRTPRLRCRAPAFSVERSESYIPSPWCDEAGGSFYSGLDPPSSRSGSPQFAFSAVLNGWRIRSPSMSGQETGGVRLDNVEMPERSSRLADPFVVTALDAVGVVPFELLALALMQDAAVSRISGRARRPRQTGTHSRPRQRESECSPRRHGRRTCPRGAAAFRRLPAARCPCRSPRR